MSSTQTNTNKPSLSQWNFVKAYSEARQYWDHHLKSIKTEIEWSIPPPSLLQKNKLENNQKKVLNYFLVKVAKGESYW